MIVRKFSHHFIRRWVEWRGEMPCIDSVSRLIEGAQQLRPQLTLLQRGSDGMCREYTVLAEFWNDSEGAILRVDERNGTAVTLICAGRRKQFRRAKAMRDSTTETQRPQRNA